MSAELSAVQARRIVLAAQGFYQNRAAAADRSVLPLARKLGVIQIDSVNVLVRSHFLPAFSRLGAYDRAVLERLAYRRPRRLFEYWGHEASLMPIELYPLFRWRMDRAAAGRGMWKHVAQTARDRRALVQRVRRAFAERGPLSASDFAGAKNTESWWGWSDTKRAVEYLFWAGELAVVDRKSSFERRYDLAERVIPTGLLNGAVLREDEAQRRLLEISARVLGVATEADLRDVYRLDAADAKLRIAELVASGALQPVTVQDWKQTAYMIPGTPVPRGRAVSALLSPFDSLVWNRARTHRLFDFHYRIEIYTPAHKRVHGYYVLPYLLDGRLVARADLKADRARRELRVHAVHWEAGARTTETRARLRDDLSVLAAWLGLERLSGTPV